MAWRENSPGDKDVPGRTTLRAVSGRPLVTVLVGGWHRRRRAINGAPRPSLLAARRALGSRIPHNPSMDPRAAVAKGYFPKELPPAFSSATFARAALSLS